MWKDGMGYAGCLVATRLLTYLRHPEGGQGRPLLPQPPAAWEGSPAQGHVFQVGPRVTHHLVRARKGLCVCVLPGRGLTQLSLRPIPMLGPAVEMQAEPTDGSTALQCGHGARQGLPKSSPHLSWRKRQGEADCSLPCNPQSLKIVQHLWLDKTGEIIPFQPPCPGLAAPHQISCPGPWAWQWAALPGPRCTLSKQFPPTSNPNYSSLL